MNERFFLLFWFVAVANAAPWDELCNLLVNAWLVEGFFSSPETPLNTEVTGMYSVYHKLP